MLKDSGTFFKIPFAAAKGKSLPGHVFSIKEISEFLQKFNQTSKWSIIFKDLTLVNKQLNILIVDDLKNNLVALAALLVRDDVQIFQAQSGSDALELMMNHEFFLALLDVNMPNMSGFELAEFMRGSNKTKNIPIIFVTANNSDKEIIFKGYDSGAVDFLRKPIDPHVLKSKVNIFLELEKQKKLIEFQIVELQINRDSQNELVLQLRNAIVELEKSVKVRDEFMSIVGHELKTPLISMKLESYLRKRYLEKNKELFFTSEKLFEMFDSDISQVERVLGLIDDMLDISRINSGKLSMNFDDFDLCQLVRNVVEKNLVLHDKNSELITIKVICEKIIVHWDKFRTEQIIINLLTNAFKYGNGNTIEIEIKTEDTKALIFFKDSGIGISKDNQQRIFQKFERVTDEYSTGLGLGLFIVSQIIEAHRGTIEVESKLGKGSIFKVTMPIRGYLPIK